MWRSSVLLFNLLAWESFPQSEALGDITARDMVKQGVGKKGLFFHHSVAISRGSGSEIFSMEKRKKRDFVYIYIIAAKHNLEKGDLWLEMCLFVLLGAKTCLAANPFFVIRYSLRQYQL